jgi:predicted RNA-binding protein YlqC (UPF0109 family)
MRDLIERLRKLVQENCAAVIDDDHELAVQAAGGEENVVFEIFCEPRDVGLIIGRAGKNIEAMRTIVHSACRGETLRTQVEVVNSRNKERNPYLC